MQPEEMRRFFESIIFNKDVPNKQDLVDAFCNVEKNPVYSAEIIDSTKQIVFTMPEIQSLAENFLSSNGIFFRNFMQIEIQAEQWELLVLFFSKIYAQHIGNAYYVSKNASSFDMGERAFDRFIESTQFFNINFKDYIGFIYKVIKCPAQSLLAKWKRPASDYLLEYAVQHEQQFLSFIFDNFEKYGMLTFDFLIINNVSFAIPKLVDYYLKNEFEQKRQVKNLLKQHYKQVKEHIMIELENFNISTKQVVELLLGYTNEQDAIKTLNELYFKEKDDVIKKLIVEKIDINFIQEINTHIKFKKQVQKYENSNNSYLNANINNFPILKLRSDNQEEKGAVSFILEQYQSLCSPYECFKTEFIKEYVKEKSLDELCEKCYSLFKQSDFNADFNWVMVLIAQNSSLEQFVKILKDLSLQNNSKLFNQISLEIVLARQNDLLSCLLGFDKNNKSETELVRLLVQKAEQTNKYNFEEIELIRDCFAHQFNFNDNNVIEIGSASIYIDENLNVVEKIVDEDECNIKQIKSITKALNREVEKQSKRLQMAFASGRKWTKEKFEEIFMTPSLFNVLAKRIIWGRYKGDKLISIFTIDSKNRFTDLESIDNVSYKEFSVGIFHPVEFSNAEWQRTFYQGKMPFNQLKRDVSFLSSFNQQTTFVNRFYGLIVNSADFVLRMEEMGWNKDMPKYDGTIDKMFKCNRELQTLAEITFAPIKSNPINGSTTLFELRFYKLNSIISTGNYWITNKVNAQELGTLNERFFSDTIFEIVFAGKK